LPATTSLAEIADAGEHYCGEDWMRLQEKHKSVGEKDLLKYCFSTAYIVALMHDSLGIGMRDDRYVGNDNSLYFYIRHMIIKSLPLNLALLFPGIRKYSKS
jgi:hypothetical protein